MGLEKHILVLLKSTSFLRGKQRARSGQIERRLQFFKMAPIFQTKYFDEVLQSISPPGRVLSQLSHFPPVQAFHGIQPHRCYLIRGTTMKVKKNKPLFRWAFALCAALFSVALTASVHARASTSDNLTSQLIKTKTGVTLNYVVQGNPSGPVIVLLHGAGDSWHSWERVFPLLPAKYRVYAITLRGHGLSDHPQTGYSRADFAADILDVLDQLHIHHATLVGHSLGSFVAQKVAEQDTDHLDRLVLIGSGPGSPKDPAVHDAILKTFSSLRDPISYTFARDFQASTIYHPIPAWFFETMVGEAERVPAATWHGLGASVTANEAPEELKKIRVPTLIFWGEKDSIFNRADQDTLVKLIPHATLKAYPETGHALHWERPDQFATDLLAFLGSTPVSRRSEK
jgi:non-heme chloroperoxidase